jgi:hypothetical protein
VKYIVRTLHFLICLLAAVPWVIAMLGMVASTLLVLLADWIWRDAHWGNCWTYVGPKWIRDGGYMCIRASDGQRFLGVFPVPHVIWVKHIDVASEIEQTHPDKRFMNRWFPFYVLYFPYHVMHKERRKDHSNWGDL